MTRELRARVGSRVDARIPGTSPGMPGHDGGVVRAGETEGRVDARIPGTSPGMTGEWPGWRGRVDGRDKPGHDVMGERRERDATANPRIASTMRSWEGMTSNSRRSL